MVRSFAAAACCSYIAALVFIIMFWVDVFNMGDCTGPGMDTLNVCKILTFVNIGVNCILGPFVGKALQNPAVKAAMGPATALERVVTISNGPTHWPRRNTACCRDYR